MLIGVHMKYRCTTRGNTVTWGQSTFCLPEKYSLAPPKKTEFMIFGTRIVTDFDCGKGSLEDNTVLGDTT